MLLSIHLNQLLTAWIIMLIILAIFSMLCYMNVKGYFKRYRWYLTGKVPKTLNKPEPGPKNKYSGWLNSIPTKRYIAPDPPKNSIDNRPLKQKLYHYIQLAQNDSIDLYLCLKELPLPPNHPMLMDQRSISENLGYLLRYIDSLPKDYKGNKELLNLTYYLYIRKYTQYHNHLFQPEIDYQKIHALLIYAEFEVPKGYDKTIAQLIACRYHKLLFNPEDDQERIYQKTHIQRITERQRLMDMLNEKYINPDNIGTL